MRPTPRGILFAAFGVIIALLPSVIDARLWTFWPVYLGAFLVAAGADALLSPRRSTITATVEMPETLYIGDEAIATLKIDVPTRRRLALRAVVDLSDDLIPQPLLRGRVEKGSAKLRFRLFPTRRGTSRVEKVWVRYSGPFGLLSSNVKVDLSRRAAVVPNIRPVKKTALRFFIERDFRAGLKIEKYKGDGTEFDSVREYSRGDDNRSIDWKRSAHHRKLIARQYRAERNHQIVLAIDTGHLMSESLQGIPKLDHAINATLLLSYVSLKAGDRVGLYTFDARKGVYLDPVGGLAAHQVISQMTGQIEYSDLETNFTLGLTSLAQHLRRRSLVVVLTDFVDTVTAELMLENLDRLARRHLVIFVALRDPSLLQKASQAPNTTVALNRAIVSDTLIHDREVVLARLKRQGVYPIDAEPSHVSAELINTYLDIKRRERI